MFMLYPTMLCVFFFIRISIIHTKYGVINYMKRITKQIKNKDNNELTKIKKTKRKIEMQR